MLNRATGSTDTYSASCFKREAAIGSDCPAMMIHHSGVCSHRLAGSARPAGDDTRLDSILRSSPLLPGSPVKIVVPKIPQNPQIRDALPKNLGHRT